MARDPFAPVTQPSIPPWVLPVGIVLGILFLGTALATVLVISRRPPVQPMIAAPAVPAAVPSKDSVAAAGTASAPDTAKEPAHADDGKDPEHARHHRARTVKDKAVSRGTGAAAPAPEVKKKKPAMNQKEIDSLLGL